MKAELHRAWRDALDVVFPRACVQCQSVVEEHGAHFLRHVCTACAQQLQIVGPPHCTTCGHPYFGEMDENRLCEHCEALVPRFGQGKTAILLKGPGRALIHALKYHHGLHVLEDIVGLMRRSPGYADFIRGKILVPVPLHARKERERSYNQSRLLAECAVQAVDDEARIDKSSCASSIPFHRRNSTGRRVSRT